MRFSLAPLILLCLSLFAPRAHAASVILSASLSPLPGVESGGSGFGEVDVSDDQLSISVTLLVSGLNGDVESGTGIYGPGQSGPLLFAMLVPFPSFTSGSLTGTFDLPSGALAELLAGELYFTVFTDQIASITNSLNFSPELDVVPTPEIGGQITNPSAPEPAAMDTLGLGLAAIGFAAWKTARKA
jgi:hypothetical protein